MVPQALGRYTLYITLYCGRSGRGLQLQLPQSLRNFTQRMLHVVLEARHALLHVRQFLGTFALQELHTLLDLCELLHDSSFTIGLRSIRPALRLAQGSVELPLDARDR